jgi:hypothetical protein
LQSGSYRSIEARIGIDLCSAGLCHLYLNSPCKQKGFAGIFKE